jgi:hypothetical protein
MAEQANHSRHHRGRRLPHTLVIASQRVARTRARWQAPRSNPASPKQAKLDCFVASLLAMTWLHSDSNFKQQMRVRILAARFCPRFAFRCPSRKRGSRECRMRAAPAVSRAKWITKSAHEHTGSGGGDPAFPAQWLYGLCCALLGERIRLVTVAAGLTADRPGRIDFATDSLAPATGVGTTQFCRTQQRRSSVRREPLTDQGSALQSPCAPTLPRPPHPIPRS